MVMARSTRWRLAKASNACGVQPARSESASAKASRRPRFSPCPATGCSVCAALPTAAMRPSTVTGAAFSPSGNAWRLPTSVKRPMREPNASPSSSANSASESASRRMAVSGGQHQTSA
ncbi:hypothetical protein D3C87_1607600 [compost metagenome]